MRVAEAVFSAFDEDLPAPESPAICRDLLRGALGFRGLAVSPLPGAGGRPARLARTAGAGVDLLCCPADPEAGEEAFEALVRAQEEDPALDRALEDADRRLLRARERFLRGARPALDEVGCAAHQDLALRAFP
jgi:beta-glucosidase-like glycosyl hydrolase